VFFAVFWIPDKERTKKLMFSQCCGGPRRKKGHRKKELKNE
jgi:hypothetical protein